MENDWFSSWFDTPYYHLLYQNRDEREARHFIDNLLRYVQLSKGARVMDLACGKGRHSKYLHQNGLQVLGIDLSSKSIEEAKKMEKTGLKFEVLDMRANWQCEPFEAIFNLFTSFGYFEREEEDQRVLKNVWQHLQPRGWFVLDFLNVDFVRGSMIPFEEKTINGVHFQISRTIEAGWIQKTIRVIDGDFDKKYQERVRAYCSFELENLLANAGFKNIAQFGSMELESFDAETSDRCLFICRKNVD